MQDLRELLDGVDRSAPVNQRALLDALYQRLHQLARILMARESPRQTLQATALVHDACLRLFKVDDREGGGGEEPVGLPARCHRSAADHGIR